ncbi:TetR/AcrR family transcriptional regulator [Streptomyces sp. NBC_01498]|uniref:helix-turn-helix domain-containing protein n=1 Tax=Streptomyces sp. NBC_01498 TaxID=2975870 RepID=UPI002E7AD37F|nr:helix-turn-helix domain-containing protein [Streptomyces sp. NBC_01498]WTL26054.1 TetR/AcrR family transcriptional regulator [Streptomyces sp. NBC_01498]
MHIQDSHWQAVVSVDGGGRVGTGGLNRSTPLRVDAQRNLEHVLRAAREVFGELGYGAPMEDVARRARVGVGTVYRRFPSKDVLVRRIAEEETSRLTEQARAALGQEEEPWSALARFLRTSVDSGAGRLLPPQVLRVGVDVDESTVVPETADGARVPQQRQSGQPDLRVVGPGEQVAEQAGQRSPASDEPVATAGSTGSLSDGLVDPSSGTVELLDVVGQLVERARSAGELRPGVTVADVLLVIATAAPALPDAKQQAAASARLLDILLEGLRSRAA